MPLFFAPRIKKHNSSGHHNNSRRIKFLTKTQFKDTVSNESMLNVGTSYGKFLAINVVPFIAPGQPIEINVLLQNSGDTPDVFHVDFDHTNVDGNREFTGVSSITFTLAGGEQKWFLTFIEDMPLRDMTYWGRSYHGTIEDELSEPRTVEALNLVDTTLTCAILPALVSKSGKYVQSGRLTRNDTGAGVAGQSLAMEIYDVNPSPPPEKMWFRTASATTDADGNYSVEVIAPNPVTTPITYPVRTEFFGSISLGLGSSVSNVAGLGLMEMLENLAVMGLAGAGAFLIGSMIARKTRKKIIVLPITAGGIVAGYAIQKIRGRI